MVTPLPQSNLELKTLLKGGQISNEWQNGKQQETYLVMASPIKQSAIYLMTWASKGHFHVNFSLQEWLTHENFLSKKNHVGFTPVCIQKRDAEVLNWFHIPMSKSFSLYGLLFWHMTDWRETFQRTIIIVEKFPLFAYNPAELKILEIANILGFLSKLTNWFCLPQSLCVHVSCQPRSKFTSGCFSVNGFKLTKDEAANDIHQGKWNLLIHRKKVQSTQREKFETWNLSYVHCGYRIAP